MGDIQSKSALALGLAALAITLALVVPWQAPGVVLAQTTSGVPIVLDPASPAVAKGAVAELAIQVDASGQPVDGAQVYLNFDPAYLQVVNVDGSPAASITPGPMYDSANGPWKDELQNEVNNATGQISFALGKGTTGTALQEGFVLGTVRFKALLESSGTSVTFNTVALRQTKAVSGLENVTSDTTGSTLSITSPNPAPAPVSRDSDDDGSGGGSFTSTPESSSTPRLTESPAATPVPGTTDSPSSEATTAPTPIAVPPATPLPEPVAAAPAPTPLPGPEATLLPLDTAQETLPPGGALSGAINAATIAGSLAALAGIATVSVLVIRARRA